MVELIIDKLQDIRFLTTIFTSIAAVATVLTFAMPYLSNDNLQRRMKNVAIERSKIRAREREKLAKGEKVSLRSAPKPYMQMVVENLNLRKWLGEEEIRSTLLQAGYRGQGPYVAFLFFRMVAPIGMFIFALFYLFVLTDFQYPPLIKVAVSIGAAYLGIKLPQLFLKNLITRRQLSVRRAFPDALDLLLICVESGMSIEAAFRRVAGEVGSQSVELAEEFSLLTAELSYLPDRRQAYDNLAKRCNHPGVKAVSTALNQAEKYGTPLASALRVMALENRELRMQAAEQKAASLPAKLTVPMIAFFLPPLFVIILGPAIMKIMAIH